MEAQILHQDGRQHFLPLRERFTPRIPPDLSQLTVDQRFLMTQGMEHFHKCRLVLIRIRHKASNFVSSLLPPFVV
ncbi:unnamed protein product [Rodentolepis nana]|uniref:Uncharacterized protein n=1 Tax=Rodentolepis nana TaxID=102285 RepID=A0A0R3THQ3_RODNA|nr:unnamed protein product [Rodentolepis nana]